MKPTLLVMASTYPRWQGDPEPAFVHELARRLGDSFNVIVSCPHAPDAQDVEVMDGVQVVRYRYAPQRWESLVNDGGITANLKNAPWKWLLLLPFLLAQFVAFVKLCRKFRPAVIHAHWLIPQGLVAALAGLLMRTPPLLVTSHGGDLYALRAQPLLALKRWVVSRAAAVTVVSTPMLDELKRIDADVHKASVSPMGVNLDRRFIPDSTTIRSFDEILFVGRLVEKKGLKHLVSALPAVLARHPGAFLTVAGDGPEKEALRQQVRMLGLTAQVSFLGAVPQDELPVLYRRAAVFVAPFVRAESGDQEGLGLVVAEALGCECPVIVGNVEAMRDFELEPVDPEDVEALATAVVSVLEEDRGTRSCRQRELREKCLNWLDWNQVARRYQDLLLTCIDRKP